MWLAVLALILDLLASSVALQWKGQPAEQVHWLGPLFSQPTTSLISLLVIFILSRLTSRRLPLWLMFGGALSNLLTFLWHSRAVDYIPLGPWTTNLADIFITAGALWALAGLLHQQKHLPKEV
jgi:lipoprotein signal peptidase